MNHLLGAAFGVTIGGLGYTLGWLAPRSGTGKITKALPSVLRSQSVEVRTDSPVKHLRELSMADAVLLI